LTEKISLVVIIMKHRKNNPPTRKHLPPNFTKHHLIPICRGGRNMPILVLKSKRHEAWHTLFGTLTLAEIVDLLKRIQSIKGL
jgi:hypothetical protein